MDKEVSMSLPRHSRPISQEPVSHMERAALPRRGSAGKGSRTAATWRVAPVVTLVLLFFLAFILRAWGTRFGLPEAFYHPDEHAIVERATGILRTGDYSPHWFNYPSAYIYVQALTYIPYFLISAARGFGNSIPAEAPYGFYYAGRLMTALVGALTVPLVYVLGRRMFGRRTGLVSAALVTFSLLHAVHSHYVTTDVPMAFLVTLSLLFSYLALQKAGLRYTLLAGLFAGLATSTKYPAAVAILPVLVVQLVTVRWTDWGVLGQRVGLTVGAFLAGFFLGTPYAILEVNTFVASLASVLGHYGTGQPGFEGSATWLWYLGQMLTGPDVLVVALALGGILWAMIKHTRKDLLLLSFVIPYYVVVSAWPTRFERNLVVLVPLLAVLAARFMVEAVSWMAGRWSAVRRYETPVLAALVVMAIALPLWAIVAFDDAIAQRDLRTVAAEWVNANVPPGSRIVIEVFSIPLERDRFDVSQLVRIDSEDLEWYRQEGIEYVIVSDGHWQVLFAHPEQYAREIETYHEILDSSVLLQEYRPDIPWPLRHSYLTIPVYHFPDVLILRFT
jgi:4-amino-4-deoxy-L-arabinose transferase-like glycosyltransferase